jgi:hypothetical protein
MRAYQFIVLTLCALAPLARAQMPPKDTAKGQDHPLLSRFEGSKMVAYDVKQFEEVMLPAGKRVANKNNQVAFENALQLEGKYTRIVYNYPKERSSLEVMRNYQAALEKAGLKPVFSCAKETCGKDFGEFWLDKRLGNNFIQGSSDYWSPFNYGRMETRYLLAKGVTKDGMLVHVAVYAVAPMEKYNGGLYLEIVEAKEMEGGKVQVMVITGATSGIGLTTARMAAEQGAKLVLAARNGEALDQLASELRRQGARSPPWRPTSATRPMSSASARRRSSASAASIPGSTMPASASSAATRTTSLEDMQRLFQTNFWGVVHGSLKPSST